MSDNIQVMRCVALTTLGLLCALQASVLAEGPDPTPRVVLPDESVYSASALDGGGGVVVSPTAVWAGRPCTLTFVYTTGLRGIAEGGAVMCNVSPFWNWQPPQGRTYKNAGYSTVVCSNPAAVIETEVDSRNMVILARVKKGPLRPRDKLTFIYGDSSKGDHPSARGIADKFAERGERFIFKVDGDGDGWFEPIAEQPSFDVVADQAVRLAIFGPSRVRVGEAVKIRISALDANNNIDQRFIGRAELSCKWDGLAIRQSVVFTPDHRGTIGVEAAGQKAGLAVVQAVVPGRSDCFGSSNTIVVYEPRQEKYHLYWADLHGHSQLSDGTGTPDDYYMYARDVAGLDVAALTDHDHWGFEPLNENPHSWKAIKDATASFYEVGDFVTFYGYEWTNWTFGHMHVLFSNSDDAAIRWWGDPAYDHPQELWKALQGVDCMTIPHHPGGGPIPTCWKYFDEKLVPAVEIASVHGVSESMELPGRIYSAEESGMVQSALKRGYRMALMGGGDTHDGHPGLGNPGMTPPGLTGIYATDLSREAIFEAIRARRVYATNGCRMALRFFLDPEDDERTVAMGGIVHVKDVPKEEQPDEHDVAIYGEKKKVGREKPRRFRIVAVGDAPIAAVTVVKNNEDVITYNGTGLFFNICWTDTELAEDGDYYYVRIVQSDHGTAWSSPIWVEVEPLAK